MQRLNAATTPALRTMTLHASPLVWTQHAAERAELKGVPLHRALHVPAGGIVEVELGDQDKLTKVVCRVQHTATHDAVYVLVPRGSGWLVVTSWTNSVTDTHSTLRTERLGVIA